MTPVESHHPDRQELWLDGHIVYSIIDLRIFPQLGGIDPLAISLYSDRPFEVMVVGEMKNGKYCVYGVGRIQSLGRYPTVELARLRVYPMLDILKLSKKVGLLG